MESDSQSTKTTNNDAIIQPINQDTVHQICSGQVVLSLAIAVKELVENAIDAGATIIDVALKEYGADLIEVSDNGSGVRSENFQALTLKHYTSKIRQFSDLEGIGTLGFRGEALSSLCALCHSVAVVTRHVEADCATKLRYDRNGRIVDQAMTSRQPGSTVTLEKLFTALPVRRKEFVKNVKREFNKMCQILYSYCLTSRGIKFSCTNSTKKSPKSTIVSVGASQTVRENIVSIFGAKQISSLIDVDIVRPDDETLTEYGIKLSTDEPLPFSFELLISSVVHGSGRSTTDRQFYFVNSRPCDPSRVIKLVNETYRHYNNHQYPFVYLNIISNGKSYVDVNVTPDKRQVFLEKEKFLLATLKTSLHDAFKLFPASYEMQQQQNSSLLVQTSLLDNDFSSSSIDNYNKSSKRSLDEDNGADSNLGCKRNKIFDKYVKGGVKTAGKNESSMAAVDSDVIVATTTLKRLKRSSDRIETIRNFCSTLSSNQINDKQTDVKRNTIQDIKELSPVNDNIVPEINDKNTDITDETIINVASKSELNVINKINNSVVLLDNDCSLINDTKATIIVDETVIHNKKSPKRKSIVFNITMDDIKASLNRTKQETGNVQVRFRSKIAPEANKEAEQELRKQISKTDFKNMEIIGQFNLGFIITKLNNDLFIVDQHATDEKYNFEQLQANTVLEHQILVNPKPLELTAGNESLLIENEEIFQKNGFIFKIDPSAPCTKKVSLTTIPMSRNYKFGKDDIDEMLFMLQDSSHTMCRPSRIRTMFASRACRKSVMIGKSLSKSEMRRLIDHMGEIDQPWV